jgi:hypothetical protein
MNNRTTVCIVISCMLVLASCVSHPSPPTPLAVMTNTPLPSTTPTVEPTGTPSPTFTAEPSSTPTITPTVTELPGQTLGERQKIDSSGFSFQSPQDLETHIRASQVTISNSDSSILISMIVAPHKASTQTVETILANFITNMKKDVTDLKASKPYPATVGEKDGLAVDVSGTLFGTKNSGRISAVDTGQPGFFVAFAFVVDGADGKGWETRGSQVFDAVLNSIQFYTPINNTAAGKCESASDPSYGYSKGNPIKVGGDWLDGPLRERAFLDNLAGPNGEKIFYERKGSMDYGNTILDEFVITGLSKEIVLYIDEYSFTKPQTPVGFTCISSFSLTEP